MRGLVTDHVMSPTATDLPTGNYPIMFSTNIFLLAPPKHSAKVIEKRRKKLCHRMGILGRCELTRGLHDGFVIYSGREDLFS